ncbi:MAG: tRNA pseudouridine(55) synthase TruB [Gammaproteobacteria bacterium]|nr:tRNA pseudouridine(55) synthase TruB [Gammaproteobacteria bacterium]
MFESEKVRLFDENKQFIGLGEMTEQGIVSPKRVFVAV